MVINENILCLGNFNVLILVLWSFPVRVLFDSDGSFKSQQFSFFFSLRNSFLFVLCLDKSADERDPFSVFCKQCETKI